MFRIVNSGLFGVGFAALAAGIHNIISHKDSISGILCGAQDSLFLSASFLAEAGHCWGCPLAALGAVLLVERTLAPLDETGRLAPQPLRFA